MNPLAHYLEVGQPAGRACSAFHVDNQAGFLAAPGPITRPLAFSWADRPVVSIIIPVYGKIEYTIQCLCSLEKQKSKHSFEVIVVDDCSPDDTQKRLDEIKNVVVIVNQTNLGFVRSCNAGAVTARGEFLVFLNNDTEVLDGWLDALIDTFTTHPSAGLVGSKLIYPDGRLQEAGGILWTDASGWNYGRGRDPSRPEYNYVREVDYCSGASIMIRCDLLKSLGGFDEHFAPAYYEDTDLAFRICARGMKVLYEPRSVVVHHEGISHGTDVTKGVKAHQVINQARFMERWGATLVRENYANGEHVLRARDRGRTRKVILIIDHYAPEPDRDAGSRSMMGIIDSLVDAGWVVKFWPHNRAYSPVYTTALERRGIEVLDQRWPGDLGDWFRENGSELDHVLVSRPTVAADVMLHMTKKTDAVLSLYGHDLHFARMRRQADLELKNPLIFK